MQPSHLQRPGAPGEQQEQLDKLSADIMIKINSVAVFVVVVALFTAALAISQTVAPASAPRNTLADYEPGLVKKIHAFGPLFSDAIPRTNTEVATPHDFVEDLLVPDGTKVRVLIKPPAPANPARILKIPPIAPGQTTNKYFAAAPCASESRSYPVDSTT